MQPQIYPGFGPITGNDSSVNRKLPKEVAILKRVRDSRTRPLTKVEEMILELAKDLYAAPSEASPTLGGGDQIRAMATALNETMRAAFAVKTKIQHGDADQRITSDSWTAISGLGDTVVCAVPSILHVTLVADVQANAVGAGEYLQFQVTYGGGIVSGTVGPSSGALFATDERWPFVLEGVIDLFPQDGVTVEAQVRIDTAGPLSDYSVLGGASGNTYLILRLEPRSLLG